ncbi:winged helix-turn-helix domain-containing protein [Shewanella sp. YIC-542]|uniref:winged helix-turn-helix domain-containing protein n=1 Tax=Shewanella mytili TaxID=3377111 RepID=UPI00398E98EA
MQLGNYWYCAQQGELRSLSGDDCQRLGLAEKRLLLALLPHRDKVVSRYQLLQGLGCNNERLLERGIARLRQKLGDHRGQLLEQVACEGFILHQRSQPRLSSGRFGGLHMAWHHYCTIILMTLLAVAFIWHHLPLEYGCLVLSC